MKISPYILYFLMLAMCLGTGSARAQLNFDYRQGMIMLKGQVFDRQSQKILGGANVTFVGQKKGLTCDGDGNFTVYAYPTDTLRFTFLGYAPKYIAVKNIDSNSVYTMKVELIRDVVNLNAVTIYPFRTKKEFEDAFIGATTQNKVVIPGIAPPKYTNNVPKAKLTNPISFLYDKVKKKRAANPDFKPEN
jgi:hypothetical protein